MPLRGVSRRPFVFALHFAPVFLSQFITCCHLNVLITCNSIFTILMEVAIVMEIRRSCPQRTQTGSTLHPCITLVWLEILYYTLQHKGGCVDASGDSSILIYPRCHGFEDYRKHKADFISDVEEHENPESSLCPTTHPPPPPPIAASCLYVCRYCPRLEEVMPHELSATSALERLVTTTPFALREPILPNGFLPATQ